MPHAVTHIGSLDCLAGGELVLQGEIVALGVRRLQMEVLSNQTGASRLCGARSDGNTRREPGFERSDRPIGKRDRHVGSKRREHQVELEGKIKIGAYDGILKTTIEQTCPGPHNELGCHSISHTDTWTKIALLRFA